jgi:hypothetical protein
MLRYYKIKNAHIQHLAPFHPSLEILISEDTLT